MLKKILFIILIINFLQSCGFTPMYSEGNFEKIDIKKISLSGDWELNNYIRGSLLRHSSENSSKKYEIIIDTTIKQDAISKDTTGAVTNFKFFIEAEVNIISENLSKEYVFKESFTMENFDDELTQENYIRSNKNNLANLIVNKLMIQLSRLEW